MPVTKPEKSLFRRMVDAVAGTPLVRGNRAARKGKLTEATRLWHQGAQDGDPLCQLALARALAKGQGALRSVRNAFRWFEAAGQAGLPAAQAQLAVFYANGVGDPADQDSQGEAAGSQGDKLRQPFFLPRDDVKARHWARLAAEQGDVDAQVLLGWLLNRNAGDQAPRLPTEAAGWYARAAEAGNAQAMVGLGGLIADGEVPGKDASDAYQLYEKAAAQNNTTAFYLVGAHLLHGVGTAADPVAARKWLLKAADAGIIAAMQTLGRIYLHGIGVDIDTSQAETWIRRAAVKGDVDSMAILAELHATGQANIPNKAEAIVWYAAAAEQGHAGAALAMGLAHLAGEQVSADPARAVTYFERAGDALPEALFRLALCHLDGIGVPQDEAKAAQLMMKAAGRKHPDALYNFGVLLYHGRGVPCDPEAARRCYEAAAELGSASAQFRLAHAHTLGQEYAEDPDRAIELFTAAANQNHCAAQINLARMLLKHRPEDRAALDKVRGQLAHWIEKQVPSVMTVLAELAWRLDRDEATARALLESAEAQADPHVDYVRALIDQEKMGAQPVTVP